VAARNAWIAAARRQLNDQFAVGVGGEVWQHDQSVIRLALSRRTPEADMSRGSGRTRVSSRAPPAQNRTCGIGLSLRVCTGNNFPELKAFAVRSALPLNFSAKECQNMKYWIDTEFIERPCTIDLISIGLVAEDGREFYAESNEVDWSKASLWTLENVRPRLDGNGMKREEIGYAVRRFTDGDEHPVFWGYFPAYD
jgi:hypothetical protein